VTRTHARSTHPEQSEEIEHLAQVMGPLREAALHLAGKPNEWAEASGEALPPSPTLDHLAEVMGLAPFERGLVALCAGIHLDPVLRETVVELAGEAGGTPLGLALAIVEKAGFGCADPSALTSWAQLRTNDILRLERRATFFDHRLSLDESILEFLTTGNFWDPLLAPAVQPQPASAVLPDALDDALADMRSLLDAPRPALAWLRGPPSLSLRLAAASAQSQQCFLLDCAGLPSTAAELRRFGLRFRRLLAIYDGVGIVDLGAMELSVDGTGRRDGIRLFLAAAGGPLIVVERPSEAVFPAAYRWRSSTCPLSTGTGGSNYGSRRSSATALPPLLLPHLRKISTCRRRLSRASP
jgi:hypothetical protein